MKEIAIIGGGVSGLSAGIYAQQQGFKSKIYEQHSITGGLCTGWDRKGYHIDGCIHWLTGTNKKTELYKVWENVGALSDDVTVHYLDSMGSFIYSEGTITLWRDLNRLEKELLELSPEDISIIKEFIEDIRVLQDMEMPVKKSMDMMSFLEKIKFIMSMKPYLKTMQRGNEITVTEYGKKFKHPAIKKMFAHCMPEGFSLFAFLFSLATLISGNGGVPETGSVELVKRMEKRYLELGGVINRNCQVSEIIVEDRKAVGIRLSNSKEIRKDYTISTCDPKILFDNLLNRQYRDKEFDLRYNNFQDYPSTTSVICSFAISEDISNLQSGMTFECNPYMCGNQEIRTLNLKFYNYEKNFAPKDHTVIESPITLLSSEYNYWIELYKDKEKYKEAKLQLAEVIQTKMIEQFPEWNGKIKLLDVATPVTFNRYTGAHNGAWMGFVTTPNSKQFNHKGKIKGIDNLYITGQWTQSSGGLPIAVLSGKFAIQKICKNESIIWN